MDELSVMLPTVASVIPESQVILAPFPCCIVGGAKCASGTVGQPAVQTKSTSNWGRGIETVSLCRPAPAISGPTQRR